MRILSVKPGHDGHIAYVSEGRLEFSFEAEKDAGLRYAALDASTIVDTLFQLPAPPDVVAISGWAHGLGPDDRQIGAGYRGLSVQPSQEGNFLGRRTKYFTSSHERSHLLCAYALSPFPQGQPCYTLIWEGHIGAFYAIDSNLCIKKLAEVMVDPGVRYAFAYALADPQFNFGPGKIRLGDAGKLMALAAFDTGPSAPSIEERHLIEQIFAAPFAKTNLHKSQFANYPIYNAGVESHQAKRLARLVSDHIFNYFRESFCPFLQERRPLLIGGGCGLNCDWNRAWRDSGMFTDVFIPPCTNDTGSAIGTAADAQFQLTGSAKLDWTVYCGQQFVDDDRLTDKQHVGEFYRLDGGSTAIAEVIAQGAILGWVSGLAEIGPRALGNRSILAAPYSKKTLSRLNAIKRREQYRPIAPVCLAEDVSFHFELDQESPWMLYFAKVKNPRLRAVTHVDGSARPQTVTQDSNPALYQLLIEFRELTGDGVLCNTSLNFNGTGFINRASDLVRYATINKLDGFVVNGIAYIHNRWKPATNE